MQTKIAASLPFPLDDDEIYEPPKDDEKGPSTSLRTAGLTDEDETFDEVSNRVISGLPRAQTIEALHGYQNMKEKLRSLFAQHSQSGTAVSKEDIESVFEGLKR